MPKTVLPKSTRCYRAASYARLSVDDDSVGTSNSILNQLALIRDYVDGRDDLTIVEEYRDDGYSGSSFIDRPDWNRLLDDIEAGKVDCIVVKDLSRLGRDHLGVSRYLERVFPAIGVRVIAITDGYDSIAPKSTADSLMLPVKNLFNSMYCRDASMKTKASLSAKRKRGEFVGSFAPYGYTRGHGADRNRLLVDPEPAGIVRRIYDCRIGGMSAGGIATMLNDSFVPCPFEYFRSQGQARSSNFCRNEKTTWDARTIIRILSNIVYTGTLVQGKTRKPDFRSKAVVNVDESEWDVCENAHEAIIDPETFGLVQSLAARDMRNAPGATTALPLSGYVFCADCGATMARHFSRCSGGKRYYYSCETHRKDKCSCSQHKIWEEDLHAAVMEAVSACTRASVDGDKALEGAMPFRHDRQGELANRGKEVDARIERSKELRLRMYSDYVEEVISKSEYAELAKGIDGRISDLKAERRQISKELASFCGNGMRTWEQTLERHREDKEIDRVLVVELLERVLVKEGGEILVDFRCGDPISPAAGKGVE